jgi:peroxiredoxin
MMKKTCLYIILFLLTNQIFGQNKYPAVFVINGLINADTGTVQLKLLPDSGYYPKQLKSQSVKINAGKFKFSGIIPHPVAFTLTYSKITSNIFVIEAENQTLKFNVDSNGTTPVVNNIFMKEYFNEYTQASKDYVIKSDKFFSKWDSLSTIYNRKIPAEIELNLRKTQKQLYSESDSITLKYVSTHPSSYIALWKFIYLFSLFGYEDIFDATYAKFSSDLQNSYAGKELANELKVARKLQIGKAFPPFACVDINNKKVDSIKLFKAKYTLIDFWYSNCSPCIAQFATLKSMYDNYHIKGFNIVGISTDKLKYKNNWKHVIKKFELPWIQYIDIGGDKTQTLSINKFPTNFLIDAEGKIITKDISLAELEKLLELNIK